MLSLFNKLVDMSYIGRLSHTERLIMRTYSINKAVQEDESGTGWDVLFILGVCTVAMLIMAAFVC